MSKKVFELQRIAKSVSKTNPFKAIEYLEQALIIEPSNPYTISAYGWLLKKTEQPKVFIDFYDNLEISISDLYIDKAYYWCLYDLYIKQYTDIKVKLSDFI